MNTSKIKELTAWLKGLRDTAINDEAISISWFSGTKNEKFSIIGGWADGFAESYKDLLCLSAADPCYAMCVKIAVNDGPYAYTDFELMSMPEKDGVVDDTNIALELNDDFEGLATWLYGEWERIMSEYKDCD